MTRCAGRHPLRAGLFCTSLQLVDPVSAVIAMLKAMVAATRCAGGSNSSAAICVDPDQGKGASATLSESNELGVFNRTRFGIVLPIRAVDYHPVEARTRPRCVPDAPIPSSHRVPPARDASLVKRTVSAGIGDAHL